MMTHIIERRQHARTGRVSRQKGPDRILWVVSVPDGVEYNPEAPLRWKALNKSGITGQVAGEFYGNSRGPRSRYADAMAEAKRLAAAQLA